ncbi:MAG: MobP2 family relaxase [Romboutsia timonensis]|jgi:hypothetical protein
MKEKRIVGVIVKSKFITHSSDKFNSYINYMNREEAIRNEAYSRYSLYSDYMGNPEKTTGLFDKEKDILSKEDINKSKKLFELAQKNKSIMWQDVFSFDNLWLEKNGLYNSRTHELDEKKIKNAVRKSIDLSLDELGIKDSAIWDGAIHFNTDNIHIHVAICEPNPTKERGKKKQKTLDRMKSVFVNELLDSKELYKDINSIIRDKIIKNKDIDIIKKDKRLKALTGEVIKNLPNDKRHWQYGYNTMKNANIYLDEMTKYYIDTYKKDDFNLLLSKLDRQEEVLKEAYGIGKREKYKDYKQNKIDELYKRMGNSFLGEIKDYINQEENTLKSNKLTNKNNKFKLNKNCIIIDSRCINSIKKALHKDIDNIKNLNQYEQLQQKIDYGLNI